MSKTINIIKYAFTIIGAGLLVGALSASQNSAESGAVIVLGILGSIFFLIGAIIILVAYLKNKKEIYLRKNGLPIEAKIQSVLVNESLEINGRNPYLISAQWMNPVTSELHIFESNNIWYDPSDHINQETVTVFIEKDNPDKYFVDLTFLPKLAS